MDSGVLAKWAWPQCGWYALAKNLIWLQRNLRAALEFVEMLWQ